MKLKIKIYQKNLKQSNVDQKNKGYSWNKNKMGGHILFFTWLVSILRSWERKKRGEKKT